jgi:hypothetical protein
MPSDIPCSLAQGISPKMPISQSISGRNGVQTPTSRGISLYFSLLAGNSRWRPVREGLRCQPASRVHKHFHGAIIKKPAISALFVSPTKSPYSRSSALSASIKTCARWQLICSRSVISCLRLRGGSASKAGYGANSMKRSSPFDRARLCSARQPPSRPL